MQSDASDYRDFKKITKPNNELLNIANRINQTNNEYNKGYYCPESSSQQSQKIRQNLEKTQEEV